MDFTYMPGTMGTNKRVYMDGEYEGPNIQYTVGPDVKHNSTLTVTNYTMISTMPIDLSISENTQDIVFT